MNKRMPATTPTVPKSGNGTKANDEARRTRRPPTITITAKIPISTARIATPSGRLGSTTVAVVVVVPGGGEYVIAETGGGVLPQESSLAGRSAARPGSGRRARVRRIPRASASRHHGLSSELDSLPCPVAGRAAQKNG